MSYVGAIQSHPTRRIFEVKHRKWWPGWTRVEDDDEGPSVEGIVRNFYRTLLLAHETALRLSQPWTLTCQDDVYPAPGLCSYLSYILSQVPPGHPVVSFYSPSFIRDPRALADGVRWWQNRKGDGISVMLWAVHTELAQDAAHGVLNAGPEADGKPDDWRLNRWMERTGIKPLTHLPSLVQHIGRTSALPGRPWRAFGHTRSSPTFPRGKSAEDILVEYPYPEPKPDDPGSDLYRWTE